MLGTIKILAIEDEAAVRDNIMDMLSAEGFEAIAAENGSVGIHLATTERPDLILCDVMMPKMDGYEVLNRLRQDERTALTPFIFLTAKIEPSAIRMGMTQGADDYLTKPFSRQDLLAAIHSRLERQVKIFQHFEGIFSIDASPHGSGTLETCNPSLKGCEKEVQKLQQFSQTQSELFDRLAQNLRQTIAKISMAVHLLEGQESSFQRDRYLDVLKQECERELLILNNFSELHKFLTPENICFLREHRLLTDKDA
ncbi:MAG: response regulator [Coleofasciculaceae cyanobacterium SM2_3_26]|nr:response regulator [Coleofasciculaceae cyanobacterium SM2_3_26]